MSLAQHEYNKLGEDIYFAYQRKEISSHEYYISNAVMMADNIRYWTSKGYLEASARIIDYIRNRATRKQDYNKELANELSMWRLSVFRVMEENKQNIGTIKWAIEKLSEAKMVSRVSELNKLLTVFELHKFPLDLYKAALLVQEYDSWDREKQ